MIDSRSPSTDAEGERLSSVPPDPAASPDATAVAADTLEPGPVVLLVDAARAPGLAADAAIELAASWAQAGRRIVLADLHLEHPVLHERLGESNRDGVVDIFLYGASLARSARPVPGRGFFLIPAGTYAADGQTVLGHARWPKLLAGFRDAHASLLLFTPADPAILETLAQWSEEAVLLGNAEQDGIALPPGLTVLATLTPSQPGLGAAPAEVEDPPTEAPPTEAPPAEPESAEVSPAGGPAEVELQELAEDPAAPPDGEELVRIAVVAREESIEPSEAAAPLEPAPAELPPPVPPAPREPRPRRRPLALWLALVVLLLVAAGALLLYLFRPDLLQLGDPTRPPADPARVGAETPAAPAAPAVPAGTALPYAVHIRAYRSQGAARDQVAVEERRLGDQPVYISPELIQGILYYRLLAGLPSDSAAALRLHQRLLDARAIDADDAAGALDLIRYTPLAFRLGEFATRSDALARADSLFAVGIPSYPAVLPYSDGSERWLLYGGAFRDSTDADGMRELLARAGLAAPLVERVGRPSDSTP